VGNYLDKLAGSVSQTPILSDNSTLDELKSKNLINPSVFNDRQKARIKQEILNRYRGSAKQSPVGAFGHRQDPALWDATH
jgi:hypothetical protein